MKVYEIVTEADNVIPFPGKNKNAGPASSFSQMANQLSGGTSSTGGTTTSTPTGSVHTANPNNPNNPSKPSTTPATDTSSKKKPSLMELMKKLKPEHKQEVAKVVEKQTSTFFGNKLISSIGRKASIIIPVLDWIEEMAVVNVLQDKKLITPIEAQNFRAAYSGACFTAMITNWAAFLAFAKTSSAIITGLRTVL